MSQGFINNYSSTITNVASVSANSNVITLGELVFGDSNGVSFGLSSNTITASFSNGAAGVNFSAGTTNESLTNLVFSNLNGISFGLNGSTMTASHNAITSQSTQASNIYLTGNTTLTSSGSLNGTSFIVRADGLLSVAVSSNSLVLSAPGSTAIQFVSNTSNITTAAINTSQSSLFQQTSQMSNYVGTQTGATNASITANSNGISVSVASPITTNGLLSAIKLSAGTLSSNRSDVTFSNSNGVSFGLQTNGVITASVNTNYLTTARASNDGIGLNTALTANGVSMTANSSGLSLNFPAFLTTAMQSASSSVFAKTGFTSTTTAGTAIAATHDTNGLSMGVPLFLTTARASTDGVGLNTLATNVTWTVNSGGISLNAGGYAGTGTSATNASITLNSNGLAISVAAPGGGGLTNVNVSAGTTSNNLSNFVFSNSNNVSFGLNGSTITASFLDNDTGTIGSTFIPGGNDYAANRQLSSSSLGQNSVYLYGAYLESNMTGSILRIPMFITNSSSAVSSGQKGQTIRFGIYTTNATNSTVYTLDQSSSYTIGASYSSNASWALSLITAVGNTTSYNTVSASSAGINLSASLHGQRDILIPITKTLSAGSYWFAFHHSTSGAGTVGNVLNINQAVYTWQTFNRIGVSTNATGSGVLQDYGIGSYSVTTAALPNGISATQINQFGLAPVFYIGNETV